MVFRLSRVQKKKNNIPASPTEKRRNSGIPLRGEKPVERKGAVGVVCKEGKGHRLLTLPKQPPPKGCWTRASVFGSQHGGDEVAEQDNSECTSGDNSRGEREIGASSQGRVPN